jgi:formamidopyrimidine-DNA glycosylase
MPELPDVELFKRSLDRTLLHRRIEHARVLDTTLLDGVSRQKLAGALVGRRLDRTRRLGKFLGARAQDHGWLVLHFGMTGELRAWRRRRDPPAFTALLLQFQGGAGLACTSRRRLGRITFVRDLARFREREHLGPDARAVGQDEFAGRVRKRHARIKTVLMDQKALAGLGNVYADEILFHSRVRPERRANELTGKEVRAIHRWLGRVLDRAIDCRADPRAMPRTWLLPRREDGRPCPRCNGAIRLRTLGGRPTCFCEKCQR